MTKNFVTQDAGLSCRGHFPEIGATGALRQTGIGGEHTV